MKPPATTRLTAFAAAALIGVTAIGVVGCTASVSASPQPSTSTSAPAPSSGSGSSASTSTDTVGRIALHDQGIGDPPAGTILTDAELKAVQSRGVTATGAYQLADGQWMLYWKAQPLPAPILAEVDTKIRAADSPTTGVDPFTVDAIKKATGKQVIVVQYSPTGSASGGPCWGISEPISNQWPTKEEALAAANKTAGTANQYVVIEIG